MPLLIVFLLFVSIPLIEIYLFIEIGGLIGAGWTVATVILTALIGTALLRQQGVSTLMRARSRMEQGQLPAEQLAEGALLVLAGALLLTPGFLTDGIGFILLFPPTRMAMARAAMARMQVATMRGASGFRAPGFEERGFGDRGFGDQGFGDQGQARRGFGDNGDVIDGEYQRETDISEVSAENRINTDAAPGSANKDSSGDK